MSDRSLSMLIAIVLLVSLFSAASPMLSSSDEDTIIDMHVESHEGSSPQYLDEIRWEVRADREEGIIDTVTGDIDAFLAAFEGPVYDGINDEWLSHLTFLESYGSYHELTINPAWTEESGVEVDTTGEGRLQLNPFAMREVRYAINWLLNRSYVIEEIYDGHATPRYQALGDMNPFYGRELRTIEEKHGFTPEGDFDKAYDMIQDAMTDAMNNPDLSGELRSPDESTTDFWQYRPPGGEWRDVEITGIIRVQDERLDIGRWFSDLLEGCHIKVDRRIGDKSAIDTWLFTDPADFEWGFYTGGWIESAAEAYQHATVCQFYTDYWPFMPGGIFGDSNRYYHLRDEPYAQELLEDHAEPLMDGLIEDEEAYWDAVRHISDIGVNQSLRVFISTKREYIPLNVDRVDEVATDRTTGWSQVFSPRTLKTTDGTFTAGQYSASGILYMDNWNNIGGSSDYYGIMQQRISKDYGTMLHPYSSTSIPIRADFIADETHAEMFDEFGEGDIMLRKDYYFDDDGDLISNLSVPEDVWFYDVQDEEWIQGGHTYEQTEDGADLVERDTAATAVTYQYHLGTWHSGHELTLRDVLAWHAFSKQLSYGEDWGAIDDQYFHSSFATGNRPYHQNVIGLDIDEDNGMITFYGDHTFPAETEIAGYYGEFPIVPWQLYEAVSHLRGETDLADSGATEDDVYEWTNLPGINYVHWVSSSQTIDFSNTLQNMADTGWIPPYLQDGPIPITADELQDEVAAIRAFQDEYEHSWISQGPFKLTVHDRHDAVIEFQRWTQDDGYPFPEDHWNDILHLEKMMHGTMIAPDEIVQGEELETRIRARVLEEYPNKLTRNLLEDDDHETTFRVYDGEEVIWETDEIEYVNTGGSYLSVNIPSHVTSGWEEGTYDIVFESTLDRQHTPARTSRTLFVAQAYHEFTDLTLDVDPTEGEEPLEVTVTISARNIGNIDGSEDVVIDGSVVYSLNVPAGETVEHEFIVEFKEYGDHVIEFGDQEVTVEVEKEDDTPGFLIIVLMVSILAAVVIYDIKQDARE